MKRFSYVFAGSSKVSVKGLQILLNQKAFHCKGIITQPDKPQKRGLKKQASELKQFALSHQIPYWTPISCGEPSFLKEIHDLDLDFCFVCSFGKILPRSFLDLFPKTCLNLHFSLLPRWRGAAPIQRALMEGDLETGVSLQVMTEELDAGDLIGSKSFRIEESDHSSSLFEKSFKLTEALLKESLSAYLKGEIKATPQDSLQVSYAKKIDKKSARIDWKKDCRLIHNKVRALYLGPQAFCFLGGEKQGKRLKIYRSQINTQMDLEGFYSDFQSDFQSGFQSDFQSDFQSGFQSGFQPGEICQLGKTRLSIACGKGVLDLLEVQKEGKKRQRIEDFLTGHPFQLKDSLS